MIRILRLAPICFVVACSGGTVAEQRLRVDTLAPAELTARGGTVDVTGNGLDADLRVFVRDREITTQHLDDGTLRLLVPSMIAGAADVRIEHGLEVVDLPDALRITPLPIAFAEAESWRLPTLPPITSLVAHDGALLAGTNEGLVRLAWELGAFVATPIAETPPIAALTRSATHVAFTSTDPARPIGWTTPTLTPLVDVGLPEGHTCAAPTLRSTSESTLLFAACAVAGETQTIRAWRLDADAAVERTVEHPPLAGALRTLAAADLDRDGDTDLLVATDRGLVAWSATQLGVMTRYVDEQAITGRTEDTLALRLLDADGDDDLDVLAIGPGEDALFVNDGTGRFLDAATDLLPFDRARGTAVDAADLDLDGRPDLVVATSDGPDRLFLGGADRFRDLTPSLGLVVSDTRHVVLVDLDRDADLDVVTVDASGALHVRFLVEPLP